MYVLQNIHYLNHRSTSFTVQQWRYYTITQLQYRLGTYLLFMTLHVVGKLVTWYFLLVYPHELTIFS